MTGEMSLVVKAAVIYSAMMLMGALAPISQLHRQGPMAVLRRSGDGATTAVGSLRSVLVIAQMATCVLLVLGSAVLFDGFRGAVRTLRTAQIGQPIVAILEARAGFGRAGSRARVLCGRRTERVARAWRHRYRAGRARCPAPGPRRARFGSNKQRSARGKRSSIPSRLAAAMLLVQRVTVGPAVRRRGRCGHVAPSRSRTKRPEAEFFGGDALGRRVDGWLGPPRRHRRRRRCRVEKERARRTDRCTSTIGRRRPGPRMTSWSGGFGCRCCRNRRLTRRDDVAVTDSVGAILRGARRLRSSPANRLTGGAATACGAALVNREAADRFFGGKRDRRRGHRPRRASRRDRRHRRIAGAAGRSSAQPSR